MFAHFRLISEFCIAVYIVEAVLKIYAEPRRYWKSAYNMFDFAVLILTLVDSSISLYV